LTRTAPADAAEAAVSGLSKGVLSFAGVSVTIIIIMILGEQSRILTVSPGKKEAISLEKRAGVSVVAHDSLMDTAPLESQVTVSDDFTTRFTVRKHYLIPNSEKYISISKEMV
jgi:hypothetical protein